MIRFLPLILVACTLLSLTATANAQDTTDESINRGIVIDIRGGVRRARIQLAVPPVRGPNGVLNQEIMRTLKKDLSTTGYFQILPSDAFDFDVSSDGMSSSTINFEKWSNTGAAGLVKSTYSEDSQGRVTLDFRFFLVSKGKQVQVRWKPRKVERPFVRREVHEFANALIEYYTGNRGVFGSRIAFAARTKRGERHIYVMDMDGSNLRRITKGSTLNVLPSFGPNGAVYYTSLRDGKPALYMNKNKRETLLSKDYTLASSPAHCKGKLAVSISKDNNTDIYILNASSGALEKRLTDHWGIDTTPTWSPDCSKIAFVSDRSGGPQVFVMDADGTSQKRLTFDGSYNASPSWHPRDKTLIAYSKRNSNGTFDIHTIGTDGAKEQLTRSQGSNKDPRFSPDGQYLVFTSDRDSKGSRIYIMTADGRQQTLITRNGSGYATPSWSSRR